MLIALDYDGVLVDSMDEIATMICAAGKFVDAARVPTLADLQKIEDLTFENVGKLMGITKKSLPLFARHVFHMLANEPAISPAFPGMPEVIKVLSQKHRIAIIISNTKLRVEKTLKQYDLATCVSIIIDSEDPAPKSNKILQVCSLLEVSQDQAIMIDDTIGDIKHGEVAGIKTMAVGWGYQPPSMLKVAAPDFIANTPQDLIDILF